MSFAARGRGIIAAAKASGFGRLIRRYIADRADIMVPIVAFNVLFSMFPIVLGVLAVLGLVLRNPEDLAMAQDIVLGAVPPDSAASLQQAIAGTSRSAGLFGVLSLVGLFFAGSGLFEALQMALDRAYHVPSRSLVKQKLLGMGMILLFALLVVAVLAAATAAHLVGRVVQSLPLIEPGAAPAVAVVGGAISLLAAFALCFAIYFIVPNLRLTARQVLPGTLFATLALVLLAQVFPLYALYFGSVNPYGAIFGLFFLLMTWAFLVALALVIGGELNAFLHSAAPPERKAT